MAIQSRRGNKVNFDKDKMLPGEFGVALDSQEAFICFGAGITKKMATDEDYADMMEESVTATENAKQATVNANTAVADFRALEVSKMAINDGVRSTVSGWSSSKIGTELDTTNAKVNTLNTSLGNQIGTSSGTSINLSNSFNGGLLLKELQGKSIQNGTPSPENKVDIVSVGEDGSVVLKVCNVNLIQNNAVSSVSGGVTFTVNSDKSITATGTRTGSSTLGIQGDGQNVVLVLQKGVKYKSFNQSLGYKDTDGNFGTIPVAGLTPTKDIKVTYVYAEIWASYVLPLTLYPMLYIGEATTYEQYKEQLVTIPLTQPLRSVGSVYDRIIKQDGVWGVERKFGYAVFDGSSDENWFAESTVTTNFYRIRSSKVRTLAKKVGDIYSVANLMCDRYSAVSPSATYEKKRGISISTDGSLLVYDDAYATSNASLFTTNLATNPIVLVYELEIPVFEPYSQSLQDTLNKLQSNNGVTNIFTTDPQQPIISVSYGKTDSSALALYASNVNDSKLDKANVANNFVTTQEGFVADARTVKTLKDSVDVVNNNLNTNKTLITPLNNWTNNAVAFYAQKIGNRVFLGGMLNVGTITKGTTLAILPEGYRPSYLEVVSVNITSGTAGNTQLNILADGTIWIETIPSGTLSISVNNISFAVN